MFEYNNSIIKVRELESSTQTGKAGENMLSKIKAKNQLTIPVEVMKELDIQQGDDINITVIDGRIVLTPIVAIEKEFWDEKLAKEVKEEYDYYLKHKEEYKTYDNLDELFEDLDKDEE